MKISKPYIEKCDEGDYSRIKVEINFNNKDQVLWFETETENIQYLCVDRIDGIVVMLLPEILLKGENIESELPISARLKYQLLNNLIPVMIQKSKGRFHPVKFNCPVTKEYFGDDRIAATGMSFGVDSMYSYFTHSEKSGCDEEYKCKLLTFFNHGSLNGQYKNTAEQMRSQYINGRSKVINFAKEQKIKYLTVDTNLNEIYSMIYTSTHTYRTIGIVLLFQKLIKNYYFASSGGVDQFYFEPFEDSGYGDIFTLSMLQTENTQAFSDGLDKSRIEKTEYLTDFEEAKNYLCVCWNDMKNCSDCPKCIRTMSALEVLGKLDDFRNVFDIPTYKKNYIWNWAKIISLRKKDYMYGEVYNKALETGFNIDKKAVMLAHIFTFARKITNPKLLHMVQKKLH